MKEKCWFCNSHEKGDYLYEYSSWDGGVGFDYIRNIQFCPLCGKELVEDLYAENKSEPEKEIAN